MTPPPRQPDPFLGRRLGQFAIELRLGSGGMGVVYRARDTRLGRTVAIKLLPDHLREEEERRERLLTEARAASSLDHPNIGTIYEFCQNVEGHDFIVMAYYEGQTLARLLSRGPLTRIQAVDAAIQVAQGLAEAHQRGIVHRDIKPSNLILTDQGTIKILDFGLARIAGATRMTRSGTVLGTAAYMSPEQANGEPAGAPSDVWALGVVLYEMLSGRVPFSGDTTPSLLYSIVHHPPADLATIPEAVRDVVDRALAKDPRDRFPSAAEMLPALREARSRLSATSEDITRTIAIPSASRKRQLSAPADPEKKPSPLLRRWLPWAALLALAAAAIVFVPRLLPQQQKGLAVLPFSVVSGDPALAEGLLETITSRLTEQERRNQTLWVVPASDVRRRGIASAEEARKLFGANFAVTGSVQQSGPSLRLTVNLVSTADRRQIGSAVIDELSGDYLRLQDQAVNRVAQLLDLQVGGTPEVRPAVSSPQYEAYLKGLGLLARWDKAANLQEAIQIFTGLATDAPRFAPARASLAQAYWLSYQRNRDPQWLLRARDQLQEALQIDPSLVIAHEILGRVHQATAKQDLAVLEYQEALRLDPRRAESLVGLARAYEELGRLREAEETILRATAIRPNWWSGYNSLGIFYYRRNRFSDAETQFRKAISLTPDNYVPYNNLGNALKKLDRPRDAMAAYEKAGALSGDYVAYQNAGTLNYELGNFPRAAQLFELALKQNAKDYRVWGSVAHALERAGQNPEKQKEHLREAVARVEAHLQVSPGDEEARGYLAVYCATLGQRDRAAAALNALSAKLPAKPEIWLLMADAYARLAMGTDARRAVEIALSKGADPEPLRRNLLLRPYLQNAPATPKPPVTVP